MGHPLEALAWLANSLAQRGRGILAGEFVSLGSLVQTVWVNKGDVVTIDIAGLGKGNGKVRLKGGCAGRTHGRCAPAQ